MRTFSVRETIGALMDSTPIVRARILSDRQQQDLASIRRVIKGLTSTKKLLQDLRAPAYWEVILEIDKVAVRTLQNQTESYLKVATNDLRSIRRYNGSFKSDVWTYKRLAVHIPALCHHEARISQAVNSLCSKYNDVLSGVRRLKDESTPTLPISHPTEKLRGQPISWQDQVRARREFTRSKRRQSTVHDWKSHVQIVVHTLTACAGHVPMSPMFCMSGAIGDSVSS